MHIHVSLINIYKYICLGYKYILEWNWVTDLIDCWTHATIPCCELKVILKSVAQICLISRDMPPKVSQVSSPKRIDTKKRFLGHHKPTTFLFETVQFLPGQTISVIVHLFYKLTLLLATCFRLSGSKSIIDHPRISPEAFHVNDG